MAERKGTGGIVIAGRTLYGLFVVRQDGLRIRVSPDDWDRLNLHEGERVRVALPGGRATDYFVYRETWTDPGYWVELAAAPADIPAL